MVILPVWIMLGVEPVLYVSIPEDEPDDVILADARVLLFHLSSETGESGLFVEVATAEGFEYQILNWHFDWIKFQPAGRQFRICVPAKSLQFRDGIFNKLIISGPGGNRNLKGKEAFKK